MTAQLFHRCAQCGAFYIPVIDPITAEPRWERPVVRRGGCRHTTGVESWDGSRWDIKASAT